MKNLLSQSCSKCGKRAARAVALLAAFAGAAALNVHWSHASQRDDPQSNTIKVNVNEVLLYATVTDRKGKVASGLNKDDFRIYENGAAQDISYFGFRDVPVTVGLVVDNSGSMGAKRSEVVAGAMALLRSSNPQDEVFTISFNEHVHFGMPKDVPFTNDIDQLEAALSRRPAAGETALYDAVAAALEHLNRASCDKKVLIVISDGGDNASKLSWPAIKSMVAHADVAIYTIGIFDADDEDQNPRVLKELAQQSGGEAFFPKDLKQIVPVCEQIAHDIRNQYMIGYVPTERDDDKYRSIEVKASAKDHGRLFVRTRSGYSPNASTALGATASTSK